MKCKKIFIIILILIFLVVFLISIYILLKNLQELNENNENTENLIEETIKIDEETQEKRIDWNYLKNINEIIKIIPPTQLKTIPLAKELLPLWISAWDALANALTSSSSRFKIILCSLKL